MAIFQGLNHTFKHAQKPSTESQPCIALEMLILSRNWGFELATIRMAPGKSSVADKKFLRRLKEEPVGNISHDAARSVFNHMVATINRN